MDRSRAPEPWEKIGISRATWYRHGKPTKKLEITLGRPPLGKVAMTGAERVRRHRLKRATERNRQDALQSPDIRSRKLRRGHP
jgi:hypothetical protein